MAFWWIHSLCHEEVLLTIGDINLYGKGIMDMATFQDLDHQVQHIVNVIINNWSNYVIHADYEIHDKPVAC